MKGKAEIVVGATGAYHVALSESVGVFTLRITPTREEREFYMHLDRADLPELVRLLAFGIASPLTNRQ